MITKEKRKDMIENMVKKGGGMLPFILTKQESKYLRNLTYGYY